MTATESMVHPAYQAIALQTACYGVNGLEIPAARARMLQTVDAIALQIRAAKMFTGPDVRLVVLPEYFLTSYPAGEPIPAWKALAAIEIDGPEYAALGKVASDNKVFIAGNAYEVDPHFPQLYFQTCFLIDDTGNVVLRYRRLISMYAPTPHDVWDAYLDRYGLEGVFPVAQTELGRIACVASEEILYPEISRALALRGAEVITHSTSEVGSPQLTPKDIAKRARAMENLAYVVSANSAGIYNAGIPPNATDGMSKIVDYKGAVMAEAGYGETAAATAELDLAALRRYRNRPGMPNLLSRQRLELFSATYSGLPIHQANGLTTPDGYAVPERKFFVDQQAAAITQLIEQDIIKPC